MDRCRLLPHTSQAELPLSDSAPAGPCHPTAGGGREPPGPAPLRFVRSHGWGNPAGALLGEVAQEERTEETSTLPYTPAAKRRATPIPPLLTGT